MHVIKFWTESNVDKEDSMNQTDTIRILQEADKRPSYQRILILKVLRGTDRHPTAEELLEMVNQASEIAISRATLYNTLQLFVDKGIIVQVDSRLHEAHYEPNVTFHPHFICSECKKIFDIQGDLPIASIPAGFKVHSHTLNINGICRECSSKKV